MIPPIRCVGGRELTEARLSPDGSFVSFVARQAGSSAIVLVPTAGGPERQLTSDPPPRAGRGLGGGCYDWMPDGRGLVYVGTDGNLWLQNLGVSPARRLTDLDPVQACAGPAVAPDGDHVAVTVDLGQVLVVTTDVSPTPNVQRCDHGQHEFVMDPTWSPDGALVAWHAWNPPAMPWDHSVVVRHDLAHGSDSILDLGAQVQQPRFDATGRLWHLSDAHGWLNLACDGVPVVTETFEHGGPTWGPGLRSFAVSPCGGFVAFTRNEHGFGRLCVLDRTSGSVSDVDRGVYGSLHWVGDHIVAIRTGARTPTQVVVHEADHSVGSTSRRPLAVGPLFGWEAAALTEPEPFFCLARDGTQLHGRIYRAEQPVGLLCWLHGGPTDQWQVTFMPRFAHWLSRGYSILAPDHRGSTGHGRGYQDALTGRWGDLDVDDVADILAFAHAEGWGQPSTTAVMGGSAGGFTALGLLARAPELVRAGVVLYPVTDLADLAERSHRFERHYTDTLVGDPVVHADRYRERSPLSFADRLTGAPLLVLHGTDDPVVPVEQSRALVAAIRGAGGSVEYHEYEGEGHGFRQPASQLDEYARLAAFLSQHLAVHPAGSQ